MMAVTTTDTEATMNRFGMLLNNDMGSEHAYCTDHVVQKTAEMAYSFPFESDARDVGDIAEALKGDDDKSGHNLTLRRCRKLVTLFDKSPPKMKELEDAQESVAQYRGKAPLCVVQSSTWGSQQHLRCLNVLSAFQRTCSVLIEQDVSRQLRQQIII